MVSMKDVAKACGVSVATVSKAMNNQSDIGEETKEKIKRMAEELGYFPNSAARALKTKRTYSLGIIFVDEANSGLTHEHFAGLLESFKVEAEKEGYDITFISNRYGNRHMSYLRHCRYRGVDGVALACIDYNNTEVIELVNSDLPVVTIDHIFNNRTAVVSDNVKGMHDLLTYIHGLGHERIAFIHGESSSVTTGRLTSFYRTMEELGLFVPEEYVKEGIYHDTRTTAEYTKQLLSLKNPPTCILYPDDVSSIGGINVIREMGLRIGEDISIAGYDGTHTAQVLEPKLTTLKQDVASMGKIAAQKLIEQIERPKTALIERIVIEGKVLEGKSVGRNRQQKERTL